MHHCFRNTLYLESLHISEFRLSLICQIFAFREFMIFGSIQIYNIYPMYILKKYIVFSGDATLRFPCIFELSECSQFPITIFVPNQDI